MEAKFILSKSKLKEQINLLSKLRVKISYSYKTNKEVGNLLQRLSPEVDFSIHAKEEIDEIRDKSKIWFFVQAESKPELIQIIAKGVKSFVIDNLVDLTQLLEVAEENSYKINLSIRMKFQEHRVGSGKYFVYGMPCKIVNKIINESRVNEFIDKLGIHIHRKSQNISEWEIKNELEDSLDKNTLEKIDFVNLGGGLPVKYRGYCLKNLSYIFQKIKQTKEFLDNYGIQTILEPGRFIAAPCIKLVTEIIQVYDNIVVLNTTIYNCALDCTLTQIKMLVEQELGEEIGKDYLLKGNSPTRDDIFRYKVKLKNPQVGDIIIFLNAGAYNYTTDFFGFKKLRTEIVESFI